MRIIYQCYPYIPLPLACECKANQMFSVIYFRCRSTLKNSPPSFWGAPISLMSHLFVSGPTFSPSFTRTNGSTRSDTQQGQLTFVQPGPIAAALSLVGTFPAGALSSGCWAVLLLPPPSSAVSLMVRLRRKKSSSSFSPDWHYWSKVNNRRNSVTPRNGILTSTGKSKVLWQGWECCRVETQSTWTGWNIAHRTWLHSFEWAD